jgi:Ion channel
LPRKVDRRFRLTRHYYACAWGAYCFFSERVVRPKSQSTFLSIFGPFSLLGLFAVWGISLLFAFALMNWSIHASFKPPEGDELTFPLYFYMSGTTLTTLGLGDVIPRSPVARLITVIEAGLGLGFVALVIAYLPVLYQAFSRREAEISLLDARAGSPPAAAELLRRSALRGRPEGLEKLLQDWKRWCSQIMESHISFPVLCYFRSQHTNQSLKLCPEDESWDKLQEMRRLYEPYVFTLSRHLRMDVAPWTHPAGVKDNWVTTKWRGRSANITN